jgi:hypothetical protein
VIDESLDPDEKPAKEGRYRYTAAHEVGHWRLHRHLFGKDPTQTSLLDADLQVLLDDVVDRNGRLDWDTARMGIFGKKRLRVLFDRLVGHIGNKLGH